MSKRSVTEKSFRPTSFNQKPPFLSRRHNHHLKSLKPTLSLPQSESQGHPSHLPQLANTAPDLALAQGVPKTSRESFKSRFPVPLSVTPSNDSLPGGSSLCPLPPPPSVLAPIPSHFAVSPNSRMLIPQNFYLLDLHCSIQAPHHPLPCYPLWM